MDLSAIHSTQSPELVDNFFKSAVWRDIEKFLTGQVELERDSLERSSELNAIIESQAYISALRLLLTLPELMKPNQESNA